MAADPTIVKKLIINVTPTSAEFTGTITAPGLTSGQFTTVTFSNTDFVDGTYSTTVSLYTDFTVTIIDNSGKEYSATQNYDDSLIFNFTLTSSEITPATVSAKLTTIKTSLSNIKTSIINKGQTPTGDIMTYATAIDNISTGITPTGTISITENGTHDVTNYASAEVNVASSGGVQYIPREVTNGALQYPSSNFTFSLPSNVTSIGDYGLYYALYNCKVLELVNLNNIINIGNRGLSRCFNSCDILSSVDLSNVASISYEGLRDTFSGCSKLTSVDLSGLANIDIQGLYEAFTSCFKLTSLSFPSLTSTSFGGFKNQFYNMLSGVTGCTVHFPSNLESVIGTWSDVTKGFGGTRTTVLFDLPATT